MSPSAQTLIADLILEWRTRRGIDTDATHAIRVGCAEQLEDVLRPSARQQRRREWKIDQVTRDDRPGDPGGRSNWRGPVRVVGLRPGQGQS